MATAQPWSTKIVTTTTTPPWRPLYLRLLIPTSRGPCDIPAFVRVMVPLCLFGSILYWMMSRLILSSSSSSSWPHYASDLTTTADNAARVDNPNDTDDIIHMAFIGNSITFVNDLPRLVASISSNKIQQNSCLHSSSSFVSLLSKGNGMYHKWQTTNARVPNNDDTVVYDFGACTVRQLLLGYDKYLTDGNTNGHYTDDGTNPCFPQQTNNYDNVSSYYDYLTNEVLADYRPQQNYNSTSQQQQRKRFHWDYVVMNDQTVQPGIAWKRQRSIRSLKRVYAKLLNRTKTAVPILLSTYGYDKSLYDDDDGDDDEATNDNNDDANDDDNAADANNNHVDDDSYNDGSSNSSNNSYKTSHSDDAVYSALGDIPEFTSRIWYGYQLYNETLSKLLPSSRQPILVPSALAFLLVHEENYSAWLQLFYNDGFHPSPHGTYLLACCLYAAVYHKMPLPPTASYRGVFSWFRQWMGHYDPQNDIAPMARLFQSARRMHTESMGEDRPFPTVAEAQYLYQIAERVVLQHVVPKSLLSYETVAQMEANEK